MITLTIDGRRVSVEAGTTVLDAARALGISIPTLCHVRGLEPAASCFVCAVQIDGRRTLSPSCALAGADGMVVRTDTADVRQARRIALELLLSDHAGDCVAPCAVRCPAMLDIPGFLREIAVGDNHRSMEIITRRLALPGALGRVCPRLCEQDCRRALHDGALAIGALHAYSADEDRRSDRPYVPACAPASGKSVGIIGAGPAGLAAAYFLVQNGHRCTLFDASPAPGGMLRYGIPAYRLPKDALDAEIDTIRALGAEFRMGVRWGVDFTLDELRRTHDAVFVAIGAQRAQGLGCEGDDLTLSGIELLATIAHGNPPILGDRVVVIGGGNTAMDCARSALRLGAGAVSVLYRRTRQDMPCLMDEVEAAEAEGVGIDFLVAPVSIERTQGRRLLVTCHRMQAGAVDRTGRRQPVPIAGSEFTVECSAVIAAIGQMVERSVAERDGLQVSGSGIAVDEQTLETNLRGVFAGGDAVLGADLAVRAVAAGRMAAVSIDQFVRGVAVTGEQAPWHIDMQPIDDAERAEMFRSVERSGRVFERDPREEARRCLSCGCCKADCCDVRMLAAQYEADPYVFAGARRRFSRDLSHPEIVYEPGKCIMCGACVRIAEDAGEGVGVSIVNRGFEVAVAVPFDQSMADGLRTTARRCAEACPTGALSRRPIPREIP